MNNKTTTIKKFSALVLGCLLAAAAQAQLIDSLNNTSLAPYTGTLLLDNSLGAGSGVSFSTASGGLVASFSGTTAAPEQIGFLRGDVGLPVGSMLLANVAIPSSSTQMDFGIMVSATATPTAAGSGNGYNSRPSFDWLSVSVRTSQNAIRANTSISGTLTTSAGVLSANSTTVGQLFIERDSSTQFTLGYFDTSSVRYVSETVNFASTSAIGSAIGFYADLRAVGANLGPLNNLTIAPIPEPSVLAFGMLGGLFGLVAGLRRK